ncbi:MAG: hypothetical protein MJ097_00785 [Dorea sp.]|nr:hypothetical protein [Dorea sp.]
MNTDKKTFVDIHAHILPGVDDGAQDMEETLELARIAAESGTTKLVATPHCNIPELFDNYFGEWYKDVFLKTRAEIKKAGIPLELLPGMEAFTTEDLPQLILDRKIMPLNQSRYILMEFDFQEDPDFADMMLNKVREIGAKPVIAHVERYEFVKAYPEIIYDWRKKGYVIQVNKASFQGKFGYEEAVTAHKLLKHNLISVVATDAHSPYMRTTAMDQVYEELLEQYPKKGKILDVLFHYNPERICENRPIFKIDPVPIDR